ncbi:MAG: hypothetical protein IPJ90_03450 [Anaerolineaceae bacterium]|nr:hypothetical protein [Anaerolineaceae bacterium]
MLSELNGFTWDSLHEYIQGRLNGTQSALRTIQEDSRASDLEQLIKVLENQIKLLHWCLPLVEEMQTRKNMYEICPIMSLEIIRLRCRQKLDSPDFAWISPVADKKYSLKKILSQEPEFEGSLFQIVEKIEEIAKETCTCVKE